MKLISLNLWGGIVYEPLINFIKKFSIDTDIFCFQEIVFGNTPYFSAEEKVRLNLFTEIANILPEFKSYLYPAKKGSYFGGERTPLPDGGQVGQAIFIKDNIEVISNGGIRTYTEDSPHVRDPEVTVTGNFQYAEIQHNNTFLTIGNLHGLWQKDSNKLDTLGRLEQSKIIVGFFNGKKGVKILAGDFNTKPDIESMKIIENTMTSLIRKYDIQSTRTSFYTKPIKYSDYVFVSPEVEVINFEVLNDEVSDHSPLLVEFT